MFVHHIRNMRAKLVCYSLSGLEQQEKNKVCRKLYGYKSYSNYGEYTYDRKGLLDEIPHKKIFDAIFIVKEKDSQKLVNVLEEFGAEHHVFDVIIENQF